MISVGHTPYEPELSNQDLKLGLGAEILYQGKIYTLTGRIAKGEKTSYTMYELRPGHLSVEESKNFLTWVSKKELLVITNIDSKN